MQFVRIRRGLVLAGLAVVGMAGAATGGYWWYQDRLEKEAGRALVQASVAVREGAAGAPASQDETMRRFREVAQRYQGTRAGEEALMRLANLQFAAGRVDEALASFEHHLLLYPRGRFHVIAGLGKAYSQEAKGDLQGTAQTLSELLDRDRDDPLVGEAYMALARVYEQQKKPDEAMRVYGQVVERLSQTQWAQHALQRMNALKSK